MGEEMCACLRDKVIEIYIGVRTLEERGVICVQKWRIDKETMLMLFESGLCTEMQGKRVIMCVIGTS